MKKNCIWIFGIIASMLPMFLGCVAAPPSRSTPIREGNESEIVIQRLLTTSGLASGVPMQIFVNGNLLLTLNNGEEGTISIPNGSYNVYAYMGGVTGEISVTTNYTRITLNARYRMGMWKNTVEFNVISELGLTRESRRNIVANRYSGFETRLTNAASNTSVTMANRLPINTSIAVLSVISSDINISDYIIGELEYNFVNTEKFMIVERKQLDQIRKEQDFQMSGFVSDDSAVSIGNMLGANIVITGELTGAGSNQQLTLKAIDVRTAQIVSMAREGV